MPSRERICRLTAEEEADMLEALEEVTRGEVASDEEAAAVLKRLMVRTPHRDRIFE